MMTAPRTYGPLFFGLALFGVTLTWLYIEVVKSCGGQFGYPLDDTYIHMAMAKTFSQHGVWGLTRYSFSSTSSSLLYTFLLSGVYRLLGTSEIAPFVLNTVFGVALICLCDFVFKESGIVAKWRAALLFAVIFGMPLGPETVVGMEHVLQALLDLCFLYVAVRIILGETTSPPGGALPAILAALAVLTRYESLALVFAVATLLVVKRRRGLAIVLMASALIPIGVYAIYSVSKGWFPVPNSIVAKASRPEKSLWPYPFHWAEQIYQTPAIAFLGLCGVVLLIWIYVRSRSIWNRESLTLGLFLSTLLVHAQFGRFGWFFRYEAYLVVLGVFACAVAIGSLQWNAPMTRPVRSLAYLFAASVMAACFYTRSVGALWLTPHASRNIHEQQYQMGLFLRDSYAGKTVLLNDIGAAAFLSDARIVDLYGLSTIEVARAKVRHAYTLAFRRSLAKTFDASIAIVYPAMFDIVGGLPPEWSAVGTWKIPDNQICWGDTVSFLVIDPAYENRLISDLREFAPKLPRDVERRALK